MKIALTVFMLFFAGVTFLRADNLFWEKKQVSPKWSSLDRGYVGIDLLTYDLEELDDYIRWLDIYVESGGKEELIFKMWGEHGTNEYGKKYETLTNVNSGADNVIVHVRNKWRKGDQYWIHIKVQLPAHYWGKVRFRFNGRFAYEKNNKTGVSFNFTKEVSIRSTPKYDRPRVSAVDFDQPGRLAVEISSLFPVSHCENKIYSEYNKKYRGIGNGESSVYTDLIYVNPNTLSSLKYTVSINYGTNQHSYGIDVPVPAMPVPKNFKAVYNSEAKQCELSWTKSDAPAWSGEKWEIYRIRGKETVLTGAAYGLGISTRNFIDNKVVFQPGLSYTYLLRYYRELWHKNGFTRPFEGGEARAVVAIPPDMVVALPPDTLVADTPDARTHADSLFYRIILSQEGEGAVRMKDLDGNDVAFDSDVPQGTVIAIEVNPSEGYELRKLAANGVDIVNTKRFEVADNTRLSIQLTPSPNPSPSRYKIAIPILSGIFLSIGIILFVSVKSRKSKKQNRSESKLEK